MIRLDWGGSGHCASAEFGEWCVWIEELDFEGEGRFVWSVDIYDEATPPNVISIEAGVENSLASAKRAAEKAVTHNSVGEGWQSVGAAMYKTVLLAYDGSVEGRLALREGARLAKLCGANVFLLAVVNLSTGLVMAEGAVSGAVEYERGAYEDVLEEGLRRLRQMGFSPSGCLETDDAAHQIATTAESIGADLVVVGHRQQSTFARWWYGSVGATLLERLKCSLLIAQMDVPDNIPSNQA